MDKKPLSIFVLTEVQLRSYFYQLFKCTKVFLDKQKSGNFPLFSTGSHWNHQPSQFCALFTPLSVAVTFKLPTGPNIGSIFLRSRHIARKYLIVWKICQKKSVFRVAECNHHDWPSTLKISWERWGNLPFSVKSMSPE